MFSCTTVCGQCYIDPYSGRQVCGNPNFGWRGVSGPGPGTTRLADEGTAGHCRITVGDGSTGSGTLVERDERTGLVLTCSHLFDGRAAEIVVSFPNGQRFAARLIERDPAHDLAALLIRRPAAEPIAVGGDKAGGTLTACGFGQRGEFRCVRGGVMGQATPEGSAHASLVIGCAVRPGDSGGAVLDAAGRIVGVVWGERDGQTYATCGRPVREFLERVLGNRRLPPPAEQHKDNSQPPTAETASPDVSLDARLDAIDERIAVLDINKQDKGDYLQPGDLNGYVSRNELPELSVLATRDELSGIARESSSRLETVRDQLQRRFEERIAESKPGLFAGLSFGKLIAGALGVSGPVAAAVIVAGGCGAIGLR